jgi:anti-sigma regulatory factor (Ser/Thr protein kinase)
MGNQGSTLDSLEGRGMTMSVKDLIRSSWKPHAVLADVDQGEIGTGKGEIAIRGGHRASLAGSSLEQTFSNVLREMATQRDLQLRIFVCGKPWTLDSAIQEQLFLVGREAVINALRHSKATKIEVEIQYLRDLLRVFVRDNGCGINPGAVQRGCDSHLGLRGMRERAEKIGARFAIWSRTGAGTEMCVALPVDVAKRQPVDGAATDSRRESAGSQVKGAATT